MGMFDPRWDEAAIAVVLASIGGQIRDARQSRGWFLSDLALRVGVSESVVCRMSWQDVSQASIS